MSLVKRFFHQVLEIPVVSVPLAVILSPVFLIIWLVNIFHQNKFFNELNDLKSLINDIIPDQSKIVNQIKKVENPNISIEEKQEIISYQISVFEKCHTDNRAAMEILNHLRKIYTLLSK